MMNNEIWQMLSVFVAFIAILFACGIYSILVTRNLLRTIIGVEILIKGVTLLFIVVGYITNQTALTQSLVITIIVIEVVVMVIAGGIALSMFRNIDSIDTRNLRKLKG
jgi:NADH:ubiquinone oxidoreductase subunit K